MNKKSIALLATIAAAMNAEPHYHFATAAEAKELIDGGLAEQNPGVTDGDKIATRLTEAGLAQAYGASGNEGETGETAASAPSSSRFAIETGIPLPSARGGKGGSVYPFDQLPVNGSFFVPATPDKPNPAKSLASTVSSATKRYAATDDKRKFTVRSVTDDAGKVTGARVWRES